MLHGQVTIIGPKQRRIWREDKVRVLNPGGSVELVRLECGCHDFIWCFARLMDYRWKPFLNRLLLILLKLLPLSASNQYAVRTVFSIQVSLRFYSECSFTLLLKYRWDTNKFVSWSLRTAALNWYFCSSFQAVYLVWACRLHWYMYQTKGEHLSLYMCSDMFMFIICGQDRTLVHLFKSSNLSLCG